jgi:hypothetical protein
MAWQNEMVVILRHLVDDIASAIYDNDRLEETIIVAAQLVITEVSFNNTYTIDVDALVLSPDPTENTKDNGFINLVVLKAACIILSGEAKAKALESIRITDGPTTIDTSARHKALELRAKEVCQTYEKAKVQYATGEGSGGVAILTPFTYEGFGSDRDKGFT